MKVSKEKRDQLITAGIVTAVLIFAVWYLMINSSKAKLADNAKKMEELQKKISAAKDLAANGPRYQLELEEVQKKVATAEASMLPVGNELVSMFETIKEAVKVSKVDLRDSPSDPDLRSPIQLLPEFPYQAATFDQVVFYGHYHEFGKFLADLENAYPYIQFQLRSVGRPDIEEPEHKEYLKFTIRLIALVRPTAKR